MGTSIEKVKSLNLACFSSGRYTKEDLADCILELIDDTAQPAVSRDSNLLIQHMTQMEARLSSDIKDAVDGLRSDMTVQKAATSKIREDVDCIIDVVAGQQRQLERLDAKDRACKLIMIGLPEDQTCLTAKNPATNVDVTAKNDDEKITLVLDHVALGEKFNFNQQRLGEPRQDGSNRPVLITLPNEDLRKSILQQSPSLATVPGLASIKLKKDQHPALRKEWKRMFDAESTEKQKPENAQKNVVFDRKKRIITVDGVIVDRFMAHF